jgi:hydrogenase expression/formation protein HypE
METLRRLVRPMRQAADRAGVQIVTGDTKVVDHGKGDGLFINTAGVGVLKHVQGISPARVWTGAGQYQHFLVERNGIENIATTTPQVGGLHLRYQRAA